MIQTNFGGNQSWESRCYKPANEAELLDIMARHKDGQIRPMGSKHSWSDVAVSKDVTLDMSGFNQVETFAGHAKVGSGTRLYDLIDKLHSTTDQTMPTLGAITQQTLSGAISTGTHGSGRQSLSHFVQGVRVAAYDPATGDPKIFEYTSGDKLKAARCGLGSMGIITQIDIQTRPKYLVEETVVQHKSLDDVLALYADKPLTQFTMTPYRWDYTAFERKPVEDRPLSCAEKIKNKVFGLFNKVGVDVLFHLGVKGSLLLGTPCMKKFMQLSPHLLVKNVERTDESTRILTLNHHYFRHEEMELFVPESKLKAAVGVLRAATEVFAGEDVQMDPQAEQQLRALGMYDELQQHRGSYAQHYPYFFRKVLPEDTLISMGASTKEPMFSCSVFTYNKPEDRENYYQFCAFLAKALNKLSDARLHWGKHFPLAEKEIAPLYPELEKFKALSRETDPNGVFRNDYTARVLGL